MPSNPEVTEIKEGLSAQRFIYRITEIDENGESVGGRNLQQVVAEGIDGSPENRSLGSPGDIRFRRDVAQIWLKASGINTITGWILIGGSESFSAPIAVRGANNLIGSSGLLVRADHLHRLEVEAADDAVLVGAQPRFNFTGTGVTVADDPGADRVNVDVVSTGYVQQIDVDPLDVTVVNTVTVTSIYSVVLQAGAMGTDRVVRVRVLGDYLNNNGLANTGLTLVITFGGTIIYRDGSPLIFPTSSIRRGALLDFYLVNRDVTGVQIGGGRFVVGAASAATAGIGGIVALETSNRGGAEFETAVGATDTTLAQTLDVSIGHSLANLSVEYRKRMAFTDIARL